MTARRLAAAILAAVVGAAFLGSQPVAAKTATVTNALQRFTPLYMATGSKPTEAEAVAIAKNYDLIAEHTGVLTPYLAAMKAVNPSLKVLAYINGAFDQSKAGNLYPTSWYAVGANGKRIESKSFANWLMLPTAAWASNVGGLCTKAIASSKYDGCFLDTLGIAPLSPGYVTEPPIDPSTHKVFTPQTWIADQSNTITATKKANSTKLIMANGLHDGSKFSITQPLLTADGTAMAEVWLRVSTNKENSFPSVTVWNEDVSMLVTAGSKGEVIGVVTKLWTNATAAQVTQWHIFMIATFLMGTNGQSMYCFTSAKTVAGMSEDSPLDHTAIGMPTGAMVLKSGVYTRAYTNGIAAVNPGTSSVTIQLGGSYINLEGKTVTSETLSAHSGDVFIK
jgi:putative glycosyl hydrolase-like family 15 (GHL15) protein